MRRSILAFAIFWLASCSGTVTGPDGQVTLDEFSVLAPASIAGPTTLDVVNAGEMAHTVVVADETGRVVTSIDVIPPGESSSISIDLPPGFYDFTCRIVLELPDGTIGDHYGRGMEAIVEVAA